VVHRQPTPEGYQEIFARLDGATLSPLARPEATVSVTQLLPDSEPQP
jgi:hypothetical protein